MTAAQCPLLAFSSSTWLFTSSTGTDSATAFVNSRTPSPRHAVVRRRRHSPTTSQIRWLSPDPDADDPGSDDNGIYNKISNDLGLEIVRGKYSGDISDEAWEGIETSAPSRWMVMQKLLGINVFTYILAAFIVFFLSMNFALGPGWLGQSLGWEDVGTFTKVSESLPANVDVSGPEYLL